MFSTSHSTHNRFKMLTNIVSALVGASLVTGALSAPQPQHSWGSWGGWKSAGPAQPAQPSPSAQPPQPQACTAENAAVRYDFDAMPPADRKAFTDAINCLRTKPSQLDQKEYPGAINRFSDWAVVHVNQTRVVHLDGFFLTWHRMFIHLFHQDLKEQCGYQGQMPYWNWPATADNLTGSNIFNGDEYSMSGNGYFTNNDPYVLAPGFSIPHGSGGGCIMSGPFKGMSYTMPPVDIQFLINGTAPPHSIFDKHETCLTRDLNEFAAKTWNNYTDVQNAVASPDMPTFNVALNGVFGGTQLGIHSGAHFIVGPPASNIFVSAQDPIWYPLHTMLDRTYVSWQKRHPEQADAMFGTMTAVNAPPSANVTLDSVLPGFGYFDGGKTWTVGELINITAGPFCYKYDSDI